MPDEDGTVLAAIRARRPAATPPTSAERASAQEAFMQMIEDAASGHDPVAPLSPTPAGSPPTRRPVRWVAMVAAAAAVAIVAVVVGSAGRGPAPLQAKPTAAQQLRAVAEQVARSNPYPTGPFSVRSRTDTAFVPDDPPTSGSSPAFAESAFRQEQLEYSVGDGDYVSRDVDCGSGRMCGGFMQSRGNPQVPTDGTAAEVRAAIEQVVDGWLDESPATPTGGRAYLTLDAVQTSLRDPAMGPVGRAELLRILAETADITAEPAVANTFGLVGTRFTAKVGLGVLELVIDPADGYILSSRWAGRAWTLTADGKAVPEGTTVTTTAGGQDLEMIGSSSFAVSYARPEAVDPLPADVAALVAEVRAHQGAIEAILPGGGCVAESGDNPDGGRYGFAIPAGLTFTHCW